MRAHSCRPILSSTAAIGADLSSRALWLVSLLALASVACGTDAPAGGPSLAGGSDATSNVDAGQLADGAQVEDAVATDAAASDAVLPDSGGGLCGDGTCDPAESTANCPLDCKTGGGTGAKACLENQCATAMSSCFNSPTKDCAAFVDCASGCSDVACVQICIQKGGEPDKGTKAVLQCGSTKGCFDLKPVCGDGQCEKGETAQSCAQDCGAVAPVCGNGKCEEGETAQSCGKDCGQVKPVCGNGACEAGETAQNCKQDCFPGGPVCGDGVCATGESAATCPVDCQSPAFCGNGKCEPGESEATCAKDCGTTPTDPISCAKSKCPTEFDACLKDAPCAKLIACFSSCKPDDESCYEQCAKQIGGMPPAAFQQLGVCAEKLCNNGGSSCGDGTCDPDESSQSCPMDCKPQQPVCGNGKCEGPQESSFSCPQDCKPTKPVCGNGACEPGETSSSCAKDCGGAQEVLVCAKAKCSSSYTKCANSPSCNKALTCMGKCTSSQCLQQCSTQAQGDFQTFIALAQCAQSTGCLSGGTTGPTCGDGKCEQGETSKSCPKDCDTAAATCKGACGGQADAGGCWCDNVCESQGDCCADKKQYCGAGPKCGDGKCEQGESQKSCPKDCGTPTATCGNGKCEQGETSQSCAQDCGPPKPNCGNGICEAPFESSESCPKDCGVAPAKPCKSKSDCADSEICCNKPQGTICVAAGQCF